jgi:uncharacterized membrane-anchored protein
VSAWIPRAAIAAGLLLVLGAVNVSVAQRETLQREGQTLLLELAPADPRSLMQGDYMRLQLALARSIWPNAGRSAMNDPRPPDGHAVVKRDANGIGTFVRIHDGGALQPGESLIQFRLRKNDVRIVTNAWFFQEGTAHEFANARYGEFRVAPDGEALLVAMRDKDLKVMGTKAKP